MDKFLPVTDAQKDGREIVGYRRIGDEEVVDISWWDDDAASKYPKPFWNGTKARNYGVKAYRKNPVLFYHEIDISSLKLMAEEEVDSEVA